MLNDSDQQPVVVDEALSSRFATMSFLCALCIVYLHTGTASKEEVWGMAANRMLGAVCRMAIPWFFLSAGYFLAGHMTEVGWWRQEITKRVRTLLVPFFIWSTIICMTWVVCAVGIRAWGYSYSGPDAFQWLTHKGLLTVVGLDVFHTVPMMWFLRTLFVLVVLSPILRKVGWVFVVLYPIYKAFYTYLGADFHLLLDGLLSIRGFAYFSIGLWLRYNWRPMPFAIKLCCSSIGIMLLILLCCCNGATARLLDVASVPFLLVLFFWMTLYVKLPQSIAQMSCPVYLIHGIMSYLISAVFGILGYGGGKKTFICGVTSFVGAVAASMLVTVLLRKCFPKFAHTAFGGR